MGKSNLLYGFLVKILIFGLVLSNFQFLFAAENPSKKTGHVTLLKQRMSLQSVSERIAKNVKAAIDELIVGELKSLTAIEFVDKLSKDLSPELTKELMKVRKEYIEKLVDEINKLTEQGEDRQAIVLKIKSLPGDPVKHLMILEEVEQNANLRKGKVRQGQAAESDQTSFAFKPGVIASAKEALIEEINSQGDIKQKAEEQIKRAEETVKKLEEVLSKEPSENLGSAPTESNTDLKPRLRVGNVPYNSKLSQPSEVSSEDQLEKQATSTRKRNLRVEWQSATSNGNARVMLNQAKEHLEKAKKAFEEGKYGEAFGLAISTQSLAENASKILLQDQNIKLRGIEKKDIRRNY
jgi:HEPN domain-containing protein